MTEHEYIQAIADLTPTDAVEVPAQAVVLIDEAVREHPRSALLWHKRGHLIQLGPDDPSHSLADALASYHAALDLDPGNVEIVEDIAHFHGAVMNDEPEAQKWFSKAKDMREGQQED